MPRAYQDIADAGGLLAVLRNGHHDGTVEIDARREAADQIERLRGLVREIVDEGRADPTIGWFRRAREALAEAHNAH